MVELDIDLVGYDRIMKRLQDMDVGEFRVPWPKFSLHPDLDDSYVWREAVESDSVWPLGGLSPFTRVFPRWESVEASGSVGPPRVWQGQRRRGRLSAAV